MPRGLQQLVGWEATSADSPFRIYLPGGMGGGDKPQQTEAAWKCVKTGQSYQDSISLSALVGREFLAPLGIPRNLGNPEPNKGPKQ